MDAWVFEDRVAACPAAGAPPLLASEHLTRALATWGGRPYAEFADEPWTAAERTRLEELRRGARERLAAAWLAGGQAAQAVAEAGVLTTEQPLHEEGWRLLALGLWARDRQGDALAALRRARQVLDEELGVEPGPALLELEDALLHQRVEVLHRAAPAPAPAPVEAVVHTVADTIVAAVPARPAVPTVFSADRLLGRDADLLRFAAAADRARTGGAQAVLVSGEAGIGKSSLLETALRQLPGQGWLVASGQCPETEGAPPGRAWFDMLPRPRTGRAARSVRRRARPSPGPGHRACPGAGGRQPCAALPPAQRAARLAPRHRPAATAGAGPGRPAPGRPGEHRAVPALCRTTTRRTAAPVGSYRTGEGDLTGALARLAARSPVRLALGGLPDAEAKALMRRVAAGMSDRAATALAERAGGNPFYPRESSLLLAGEGEQQALARIPQGVQDMLRRRLALLAPTATAGLRLAAVAGREAPVALLVHAADCDADQLLDALDAGVSAGLLTEPRPGTVRFSHAQLHWPGGWISWPGCSSAWAGRTSGPTSGRGDWRPTTAQ
ncbi:BTAD domain-containing putative transcriptional regulator [Streptomyces sp. NPDC127110]|uniref:BTAD domain-containing putative transcriptional regulator n=1 Tax=Streptomyces sp. NPDC127110 TaxID=3345362 RepID=UPI00362FF8B2